MSFLMLESERRERKGCGREESVDVRCATVQSDEAVVPSFRFAAKFQVPPSRCPAALLMLMREQRTRGRCNVSATLDVDF